jgi:hypothetical protein
MFIWLRADNGTQLRLPVQWPGSSSPILYATAGKIV